MRRISGPLTEEQTKIGLKLFIQIFKGLESIAKDYGFLFSKEELDYLSEIAETMNKKIDNFTSDGIEKTANYFFEMEEKLKNYAVKTWNYELSNGNYLLVSWFKKDEFGSCPGIISASLTSVSNPKNFCKSTYGIAYDVNYNNFIAGNYADAATILQGKSNNSIYSVGKLDDNKVINSYNLAVSTITPKMIEKNNDSKYNEIILHGKYSHPKYVVQTENNKNVEMVELISSKLNIPIVTISNIINIK